MARKIDIIPDAQYDPTFQPVINGRTRLAHSITLSKFLGSYNDPISINHLDTDDKLILAKQYYLHAQVLQSINSSPGLRGIQIFEKFRMANDRKNGRWTERNQKGLLIREYFLSDGSLDSNKPIKMYAASKDSTLSENNFT